jgi:hypothetical protein
MNIWEGKFPTENLLLDGHHGVYLNILQALIHVEYTDVVSRFLHQLKSFASYRYCSGGQLSSPDLFWPSQHVGKCLGVGPCSER